MNTPPAPLSLAERNRRWNLARDLMRAEGLQALVVYGDREAAAPAGFSPDCYFSNDRPGSLVVFIGDEAPRVYTFASLMIADHIQSALRGDVDGTPGTPGTGDRRRVLGHRLPRIDQITGHQAARQEECARLVSE